MTLSGLDLMTLFFSLGHYLDDSWDGKRTTKVPL
jgi:hypothetical protein